MPFTPSCPITLVRTSLGCWRNGTCRHSCLILFLISRRNYSVVIIAIIDITCGFFTYVLYRLIKFPSSPILLRVFGFLLLSYLVLSRQSVEFLSNYFFVSVMTFIWVLSFFYWYVYYVNFHKLKQLVGWFKFLGKSYLVMMYGSSIALVTYYHTFHGWKYYKVIILHYLYQKSDTGLIGLNKRLYFLQRSIHYHAFLSCRGHSTLLAHSYLSLS